MNAVLIPLAFALLLFAAGAYRLAAEEVDRRPPIDREVHEKTELATFALG